MEHGWVDIEISKNRDWVTWEISEWGCSAMQFSTTRDKNWVAWRFWLPFCISAVNWTADKWGRAIFGCVRLICWLVGLGCRLKCQLSSKTRISASGGSCSEPISTSETAIADKAHRLFLQAAPDIKPTDSNFYSRLLQVLCRIKKAAIHLLAMSMRVLAERQLE